MDQLETYLQSHEIEVVIRLLECIVDHSDEYENLVRFQAGDNQLTFMPLAHKRPVSFNPGNLTGSRPMLTKLESMRWIQVDAPTPVRTTKRGMRGGESNGFFFTPQAMEAFRLRNHVTDEQIRKAAGEHVFELYRNNDDNFLEIDVDAIIRTTGAERKRVIVQLRLLRDMNILNAIAPMSAADFGLMSLTQQGIQWAISDFPKDLAVSPPVNVTVNIDVGDLLRAVAVIDAPDEQKEEIRVFVEDLQIEPTIEKVSRLFQFAANFQQLAPSVMRFVQDNGPALMNYLPN